MPDLDLNGLRKRGSAVLLEEHSYCEVPAGCGGVVLRWVRADGPVDVEIRTLLVAAEHTAWVDGACPERDRIRLEQGPHVLALHLRSPDAAGFLLAHIQLLQRSETADRVVTAADGSWRATSTLPPDDAWRKPGFDDSGWTRLVERQLTAPPGDRMADYRLDSLRREGALPLGLPPAWAFSRAFGHAPPEIWARRTFVVGPEGLR